MVVPGLPEILEPFLQPNSEPFALALPADKMIEDEQQHFPQYAKYVLAFIKSFYMYNGTCCRMNHFYRATLC